MSSSNSKSPQKLSGDSRLFFQTWKQQYKFTQPSASRTPTNQNDPDLSSSSSLTTFKLFKSHLSLQQSQKLHTLNSIYRVLNIWIIVTETGVAHCMINAGQCTLIVEKYIYSPEFKMNLEQQFLIFHQSKSFSRTLIVIFDLYSHLPERSPDSFFLNILKSRLLELK